MYQGYLIALVTDRLAMDGSPAAERLMGQLACDWALSQSFDAFLKLRLASVRFDNSVSAEMTIAGVRAGAAVDIGAATWRGEFAVACEIDAAGSIPQDRVMHLLHAFERQMRRPNRQLRSANINPTKTLGSSSMAGKWLDNQKNRPILTLDQSWQQSNRKSQKITTNTRLIREAFARFAWCAVPLPNEAISTLD
jgi:hypothetical protein